MNPKLLIFTSILASIFLLSCASDKPVSEEIDTVEVPEATINFPAAAVGKYEGTVPCPDCVGIFTTLTLHLDQTYKINAVYLGKSEDTFQAEGSFDWNADEQRISLNNLPKGSSQYLLDNTTLIQLDSSGTMIEGANASKYAFKQVK